MNTNPKTYGKPMLSKNLKRILIIVAAIVLILVILLAMIPPFVTVPTGYTGVVTTFGKVEDYTLSAGFHIKNPIQNVVMMDNRTQKAQLLLTAFSSDIQQVDVICSVNYAVDRETAQNLYKNVGSNYYATVMEPRVLENVKAVFAQYSAEKIMVVRNSLSTQIKELLEPEMKDYGIQVVSIAIENVDFTDAFTDAVEAKQVAEQTKLKVETEQAQQVSVEKSTAEREIIAANADAEKRTILANADAEVAKINADASAYAKTVQAEAEAAANKLIADSVTKDLIAYVQANGWNGQLPQIVGSDTVLPILDSSANTAAAAGPSGNTPAN